MLDENEAGGVINKETTSGVHVVKFGLPAEVSKRP
jgi:hypothetical protein